MTAALVKAGAFKEQPFTVVDVGARGGVASYWSVFGDHLRIIGFDLDPAECARLNSIDPRTQYLPFALDREAHRRTVPAQKRSLIVAACLFEIFGLSDCAAELIRAHRDTFGELVPSDQLLDLLVPEVKGQRLTYKQYMDRDLVGDPLLRPTDGKRFPEMVIPQYDGDFSPSWKPKPQSIWHRILSRFRR
ncbi:MAG: hypothetical protein ACK4JB_22025 [Reyranella sp.]